MPRGRRVLVEGGLYHVYNRFARGEDVFADPEEAVDFLIGATLRNHSLCEYESRQPFSTCVRNKALMRSVALIGV